MTLDPPVFVTVSDRVRLLPTVTLPKLRFVGFEPSAPTLIPVADRGNVNVGLDAFEVIVTLPVAAPVAWGANVTVKVVLWDAPSANGGVIPLSWNPGPLIDTCEILTLDPPVLVREIV